MARKRDFFTGLGDTGEKWETHAYRGYLLVWSPRKEGFTIEKDGHAITSGFYPLAEARGIVDQLV